MMGQGVNWAMLLLGALMNVWGIYAVKGEMATLGAVPLTSVGAAADYFLRLAGSLSAVLGAAAIFLATLPYAVAVSRMDLSVAYPASIALSCLILLPFTVAGLGEILAWPRLTAIGLLMLSVYLLYR